MKEVFVYLEGPSDQLAMRALLAGPAHLAAKQGSFLDFFPLKNKQTLLNKGPTRALNILRSRPNSFVFLVPDLYPKNMPFPHATFEELKREVERRFEVELRKKRAEERLKERFRVHCFKYDLEVLLLASEESLLERLNVGAFSRRWVKPVEDQNHNNPPKRIVEGLFSDSQMRYRDTIDAPWVLERSDYRVLQTRCAQNFEPFLQDLFTILELRPL